MTPTTITELEAAVSQLSTEELASFRAWFAEFETQARPKPENQLQDEWQYTAAQNLARAYGDEEPTYTIADLKRPNPDYAGR